MGIASLLSMKSALFVLAIVASASAWEVHQIAPPITTNPTGRGLNMKNRKAWEVHQIVPKITYNPTGRGLKMKNRKAWEVHQIAPPITTNPTGRGLKMKNRKLIYQINAP